MKVSINPKKQAFKLQTPWTGKGEVQILFMNYTMDNQDTSDSKQQTCSIITDPNHNPA